jgi:predicted  nucleic acid-binding Zn ribbon protein
MSHLQKTSNSNETETCDLQVCWLICDLLQKLGLIEKSAYRKKPVRYASALTEKGRDLRQAIGALAMWSKRYVPSAKINETLREMIAGR